MPIDTYECDEACYAQTEEAIRNALTLAGMLQERIEAEGEAPQPGDALPALSDALVMSLEVIQSLVEGYYHPHSATGYRIRPVDKEPKYGSSIQ